MAGLTPREKLQPSLLDRLTDDRPDQKVSPGGPPVLSMAQLRARVRVELSCIMNATRLETVQDLSEFPHVRASGINYGIPDLSGKTASGMSSQKIEKDVKEAILRYEPRLMSETVQVNSTVGGKNINNSLVVEIAAELWGNPLPEKMKLRTLFSLEDGEATVEEQ